MMRSLFTVSVLIVAGTALVSPGQPTAGGPPSGGQTWKLIWSDEFDGPNDQLDRRWHSQNSASTHILSSRWRENAVVANGTLRLINKKEKRGGNDWTSGSIWTKEQFQYGYFECRYRYAAAEGTNNSFWLMTTDKPAAGTKSFEIDINEGHYPNEINTNIHNHSDTTVVNGRKTHPTSSKSFQFGVRPDVTIQLENPVKTKRIRFSSDNEGHVHLGEFRIFNPTSGNAPETNSSSNTKASLVNFAAEESTEITASGFVKEGQENLADLTDDNPETRWTSQKTGGKWVEFEFPDDRVIGCIRFLNGYGTKDDWKGLLNNYQISWHDGSKWVVMSSFDVKEGNHNFARDFQTFGLLWTENQLVFYFNGKEIRREKNTFCHRPSPVWLSLAIIPWAGRVTDAIDGTSMEVDYVRIYQMKP